MTQLVDIAQLARRLETGQPFLVAGTEESLRQLPRGNWIGGTTPVLVTERGPSVNHPQLLATELPYSAVPQVRIASYGPDELHRIVEDYPDHGFSVIVLPAESRAHLQFARESLYWPGLFRQPLVGWVAGVPLAELGSTVPWTFDGSTGESHDDRAVVLHASLASEVAANVQVVNIFERTRPEVLTFPETGFVVGDCLVNGEPANLADHLNRHRLDPRWPLVGERGPLRMNASIQSVDTEARRVHLYAPVFSDLRYRIAAPLKNYPSTLRDHLARLSPPPLMACNCILNFVYGEMHRPPFEPLPGPISFGEICHTLLNQTVVSISLEKRSTDAADGGPRNGAS